jgi:hypothetical protein
MLTGVQHIVLVGSMGVSPAKNTPDNTLNKIGDGMMHIST